MGGTQDYLSRMDFSVLRRRRPVVSASSELTGSPDEFLVVVLWGLKVTF